MPQVKTDSKTDRRLLTAHSALCVTSVSKKLHRARSAHSFHSYTRNTTL